MNHTKFGEQIRQWITPLIIAACWTYAVGYTLGQVVHLLNKTLSGNYKVALGLPVALPAVRYEQWTCKDLRVLLGDFKKKALKADLVAMAYCHCS